MLSSKIQELNRLVVDRKKPESFHAVWTQECLHVQELVLQATCEQVDYPVDAVCVMDVQLKAADGTILHGWLLRPTDLKKDQTIPLVIHYHGLGYHRGRPGEFLDWVMLGTAVLVMDFRSQGGKTGSKTGFTTGGWTNWYAWGLPAWESYYLRFAYQDTLLGLRFARTLQCVDKERIALDGVSQGGGTALAMAGLNHDVCACMADVPSHCWWEKRINDRTGSASGIAEYLRRFPDDCKTVLETMDYFDNLFFAESIRCPVLVSCGMKDPVCPPECVHAAVNRIPSDKQVIHYPFGEHDGGGSLHRERKLTWFKERFL